MAAGNPLLSSKMFVAGEGTDVMTLDGTLNKTFIMLLILLAPAAFIWFNPALAGLALLGMIGGLVLALVTIFKKEWSPYTVPAYAFFEGLLIGGVSIFFETLFPGIVLQAVGLTMGVLFLMLFLYRTRVIKVTDKLRVGVMVATGAVALIYVVSWIMSFFGTTIPYIHEGGTIGIIFSLVVVGIAAFNLLLDFDFIEKTAGHAKKYMEWFAAFGLMITLIWLYLEILRLLAKTRER
jgi:uncharacterized YccA/Bax inhibitor family protein